jgi:hypothetical protein
VADDPAEFQGVTKPGQAIVATYVYKDGTRITISWDTGYYNPNRVLIDTGREGATVASLRGVPMEHAKRVLRPYIEKWALRQTVERLGTLPTRLQYREDYYKVAQAYVLLHSFGSIEPIRRLVEWTGESPDTWSARLRRAKARGYIVGTGRTATVGAMKP